MKLQPLNDWALIRPKAESDTTAGGLYIPESAKEKPRQGEVLAVGKGRFKEDLDRKGKVVDKKFVPTEVKPGDKVLYEKYGATDVEIEGEELVLVREENILGRIP